MDMKVIYKQVLQPHGDNPPFKFKIPAGATILTYAEQHDQICVWYELNFPQKEEDAEDTIEFGIIGTGMEFTNPEGFKYQATVQLSKGLLIFHIYTRRVKF